MRDQLTCGSCYAFAATAMLESRVRVAKNISEFISPQDVVSCNPYSQGCDGGFAYLVAKYAQDFGIVQETCFPYTSGIMNQELGDQSCDARCETPKVKICEIDCLKMDV